LRELSTTFEEVIVVAGEDRLKKYKDFAKYIHPETPPEKRIFLSSIEYFSVGSRDPEADGMTAVSATRLRELAQRGNYEDFKLFLPSVLNEENAKQLYMDVRKGLGQP
jgi:hypothetical protein